MSILTEIKKSQAKAFRRIYLRRRVGNDYEADWTQIPSKYIKKYGEIEYGLEDIKINFFKYSGFEFTVDNVDGYFSDVDEADSYFYGATCIPLTMVKVEAGYEANDGTEYPTNTTMFIGLLDGDLQYPNNNSVNFKASHLSEVFNKFNASEIPNIDGAYTASEIFTKIKDYQDTNTVYVFRKYISNTAWNIETTTSIYNMATTTSLDGITAWELMGKLAEAENKYMYVSRDGSFYFQSKSAVSSTPVFHFSGLGDTDKTWGNNIMKDISLYKMYSKIYNRIRVQHDKEDTTTSFYTKKENWAWGDSTSSWLYGVNTYEVENEFLNASTSAVIADAIYTEYVNPKKEVEFNAKFLPHLNLNDYCTVTYISKQVSTGYLWGIAIWGQFTWNGGRTGYNINLDNSDYRLLTITHNLDKFSSKFRIREI
jgi:hypothetical protein